MRQYLMPYLAVLAGYSTTGGFLAPNGYSPTPTPKEPTERQRQLFREHKTLREFSVQGHKIMAYSKKDAITRLTHQGLIKRKKNGKRN